MTKDRIVFFANGDFAIDTFEMLVNNGINIIGLVTSANDKVRFHKKTIRQIAEEMNIPYYLIKGENFEEDDFFKDWLKRINADIFCVISFKKLPKTIISMAKKCAFNVHASLLPFLRGAAPINWAIRLGYKETGLTAFVLNDKIDQGDIIANTKVKIAPDEKYTTLYNKLSKVCIDFTEHVFELLQNENWKNGLITQPVWSKESEVVFNATKINKDYFNFKWTEFSSEEVKRYVNSVDNIGIPCKIVSIDSNDKTHTFDAKIYEVEAYQGGEYKERGRIDTDNKTYLNLYLKDDEYVSIKKIQIVGKKVMSINDFLNGFKFFDGYLSTIYDLPNYEKLYSQN